MAGAVGWMEWCGIAELAHGILLLRVGNVLLRLLRAGREG